jgi:hypothetical protein
VLGDGANKGAPVEEPPGPTIGASLPWKRRMPAGTSKKCTDVCARPILTTVPKRWVKVRPMVQPRALLNDLPNSSLRGAISKASVMPQIST